MFYWGEIKLGINISAVRPKISFIETKEQKQPLVKSVQFLGAQKSFNNQLVSSDQALVYFTGHKRVTVDSLVKEIRPVNLRKHLGYLASDKLLGRLPDTVGADKAKKYLLDEYQKAGLKPFRKLLGKSFVQNACYQTTYQEMVRDPKTNKLSVVEGDDAIRIDADVAFIQNIVGYIPAKRSTDKYVIMMAHYDHLGRDLETGKIMNGADDNASGVAVMLETARIMAKHKYDKNVIFVATSGEETKCMGSKFLMKRMQEAGLTKDNVEILNLDCLAAEGDYISIVGKDSPQNERIEKIATDMSDHLAIPYDDEQMSRNAHTDAEIFDKAGYPAITFVWAYDDCLDNRAHLHKPEDVEEIVNYDGVKKSAQVAVATLFEMSKKHKS